MDQPRIAIIGAGISGLAVSHHLHHENTIIFEATDRYSGHVHSETIDGFTWDDGPHVSFTVNAYVREFLNEMIEGEDEAIPSLASNYYRGHWIDHPAQVNLYDNITGLKLEVDQILPLHGRIVPLSELLKAIGKSS